MAVKRGPGARPGREGPLTDTPRDAHRNGGRDTRDTRDQRGGEPLANGRTRVKIVIPDDHSMVSLLGSRDELLQVIEGAFGADIHVRGNEITVTGSPEETELVTRLFDELTSLLASGAELAADVVERSVAMLRRKSGARPADVLTLDILSSRGRTIRPKTLNQKRYVDAIDKHTIVFAIGPAGTGKTYLAMAKAVKALQAKEFNRIILTRPAVEAGERLGFLPGTLYEKIDPYLRPLYDALHDMIDPDSIPKLTANGTIEIAPLAYMRGRSQPVGTPVLTPDGFRPIGSLAVGDLVTGSGGEPTPVIGVYPQGEKEIYRVTTRDGGSASCSGDHLWAVSARDDRAGQPLRVLTAAEMAGNLRDGLDGRYELPLHSAPVCFPDQDVPLDPYLLGQLLGGVTAAAAGSGGDLRPGPRPPRYPLRHAAGAGPVTALALDPATEAASGPGLAAMEPGTVSVPEAYLYNSAQVRAAVLQGLLDTNGGNITQRGRACRLRYTTASAVLRDNVIFLVRSLGGVAESRICHAGAHVIDIRLPAEIDPFRLARKLEKYRAAGGGERPRRFIASIEPAGKAECVCIAVAAADSLYTTEDFLLTHNTLNDSFIILDEAQNTSPEQMKMFLTRLGFGSRIVVTGDVTQVDLPSGHESGLRLVQDILDGVEDVYFSRLTSHDVVRHKLVADIVDAYQRYDERQAAAGNTERMPGGRPRRPGNRPH
jgi:phosphate starvation-inducible protein PhoH and related proteins